MALFPPTTLTRRNKSIGLEWIQLRMSTIVMPRKLLIDYQVINLKQESEAFVFGQGRAGADGNEKRYEGRVVKL